MSSVANQDGCRSCGRGRGSGRNCPAAAIIADTESINEEDLVERESLNEDFNYPIVGDDDDDDDVPAMISMYNRYMHGVDVFDQVRKYVGCDLTHATKKCTVHMFEIMFSMILAQAYNIHRYVHRNTQQLKGRTQFLCSIIRGVMRHPVVNEAELAPIVAGAPHKLLQLDLGSKNDGTNRRLRVACRVSQNTNASGDKNYRRATSYFCTVCQVGFHPDLLKAERRHFIRGRDEHHQLVHLKGPPLECLPCF